MHYKEIKEEMTFLETGRSIAIFEAKKDIPTSKGKISQGTIVKLYYKESKINKENMLCFDIWSSKYNCWLYERNRYYGEVEIAKADFITDDDSIDTFLECSTELEIVTEQIDTLRSRALIPSVIIKAVLFIFTVLGVIILKSAIHIENEDDIIRLVFIILLMISFIILAIAILVIKKQNMKKMESRIIMDYVATQEKYKIEDKDHF